MKDIDYRSGKDVIVEGRDNILYKKEDGIGIIILNRPDKLNALTREMNVDLGLLTDEIKRDDQVRAVILTGNGRAFCAGTDISDDISVPQNIEVNQVIKQVSTEDRTSMWIFTSIPKPTICAINGAAVGLGAGYPLMCDVRIASEDARFGQVFVLRGLVPDVGAGTYLLPRIVGLSKACELVFSGEIINAQQMLDIGLVSEVVPRENLMPAAIEMAKKLSRGAPLALKMAKQLMYTGLERSISDHQEASRYCFELCRKTEDYQEGIKSFLEKREPKWIGR
ncbi:MAG: enoyl-CoA hydratase-related protein [Dehalococcoidales bacterium]|nr:enoyl-CoA hydratase-related protein [Dehalococcoidales bacterium]